MSERANIHDVAARAGVSIKTVSRVLNGHAYVSSATRLKVQAAMDALGFRPSMAARMLAGNRSGLYILIYDNHSPYYMNQVQTGCWQRAQESASRLLSQPVDVADPDVGEKTIQLINDTQASGVILSSPVTDCVAILEALHMLGVPYVRISPGTDHARVSSVYMDDVQAADDMTMYLVNHGHRHIAFIKGHENHMASGDRLNGYRRALARAGIEYQPRLVMPGQFDFDSGYAAATRLLQRKSPPSAIFASNDDMAAGALAAAHKLGVSVPNALSVAGFDDTELARAVWPPLTTIRQPVRELAYTATDLLLSGGPIAHQRLPHLLIRRASVAPLKASPKGIS